MAEAATTTTTTTADTTTTTTAKPWYDGKVDAEIIGHWDNKGWDKNDASKIAIEATKAARELQKHFGVPADQIIKLPKELSDEAAMKPVFQRLGVPNEAKDYDLASVKFGGADLEQSFADMMRGALLKGNVAKDRAAGVTTDVVKWLEQQEAADNKVSADNKATQIATLKKNWGNGNEAQFKINEGQALAGAAKMGLTQEQYNKITEAIGIDVGAEFFRKIGAGLSEDTFRDGGDVTNPTTVPGAQARLAELQANPEWAAKVVSKTEGAAEKAEMARLLKIIHAE